IPGCGQRQRQQCGGEPESLLHHARTFPVCFAHLNRLDDTMMVRPPRGRRVKDCKKTDTARAMRHALCRKCRECREASAAVGAAALGAWRLVAGTLGTQPRTA